MSVLLADLVDVVLDLFVHGFKLAYLASVDDHIGFVLLDAVVKVQMVSVHVLYFTCCLRALGSVGPGLRLFTLQIV